MPTPADALSYLVPNIGRDTTRIMVSERTLLEQIWTPTLDRQAGLCSLRLGHGMCPSYSPQHHAALPQTPPQHHTANPCTGGQQEPDRLA